MALYQIILTRKQLYLTTITNCVKEFRKIPHFNRETTDEKIILSYLDLTNEELFYIQNKYTPHVVAMEWMDGIINFLPLMKERSIINADYCIKILVDEYIEKMHTFPRLQQVFTIRHTYDLRLIYSADPDERKLRMAERKRLSKELLKNNNNFRDFDVR